MVRVPAAWRTAQGIEAVSFFAAGKKDTSVKPGSRREAPGMRPNQGYKFLCVYPDVYCLHVSALFGTLLK
jgi:hypothetical protein